MLTEQEINGLISELNSVKADIRNLRFKLNSVDKRKEDFFREKRKISSDIHARIKDARYFKDKRNSLTGVVKNAKFSKEEVEQKIKTIEPEISKLKEEKKHMLEKSGVDDPAQLKKNIKQVEFKIETEGLSFEKEKEMMKVLTKMRKQYDNCKNIVDIEKKLDVLYRELRELRQQSDFSKKIVHETARESQKQHVELLESSKNIDELKSKEESFDEKITVVRDELNALNNELHSKIEKADSIRNILKENNVQLKEDQEKTNSEILKQKDNEVQDKIKSGKKLTTEDLLILQRTMK